MGQRLVVDLIKNNEVIAAIYYHWSAYFSSTVYVLSDLSKAILKAKETGEDVLESILYKLEEDKQNYNGDTVHGGVCGIPEDMEVARQLFPNHNFRVNALSRNEGLISFSRKGIDDCHKWEEGHAEIDLDTLVIENDVDLDPDPYEFVDVEENDGQEEDNCPRPISGRIEINGHHCNIDAFDCTCQQIIRLAQFMEDEWKIYRENQAQRTRRRMELYDDEMPF